MIARSFENTQADISSQYVAMKMSNTTGDFLTWQLWQCGNKLDGYSQKGQLT
jgi:hypothetical protein